ncbi:hypothetical protein CTA2_6776 [Colletotrichum tanaceti]|uniref:Uncharacterized protein n=1 Tax=Colletotrichum tanaceti TaxID=1306861 RepID=A0A4U6XDS0_9PEZI|nr:hypothetical protein CTA2_6776 [Colletotrichum tanaceti]TKW53604.1 hypothetical protein CTA1_2727 [Colletotrichum tanaceti]
MKTSATLVLTASALASAQVTYNETTSQYVCSRPNSAFCAGDSFGTDIIIRCDANARGQPGRCSDNLAGQFPVGVRPALCWQSQPQAGDAACEKNCVVYADQPFRLPVAVCTPYATPSGTAAPTITYPFGPLSSANNGTVRFPSSSRVSSAPRSTGTGTGGRTTALSSTVRFPSSSRVSSAPRPMGTGGTGGGPIPSGNNTAPTSSRGGGGGGGSSSGGGGPSGTRTPVPPSGSASGLPPTVPTAGAAQNAVGPLAIAGLVAAYFL